MAFCFTLAERLVARGLSVFPIPRPGTRPGPASTGKVPVIPWNDYQTRFPTRTELVQWFRDEPMNVAIVTGTISSIVVIDVDDPDAVTWLQNRLPATPWQTSTSRGRHFYFQHPGRLIPNRARLMTVDGKLPVDVRGDGGYVLAPGSLHASGVRYAFVGDWSVPRHELPVYESGWFAPPPVPNQAMATRANKRVDLNSPVDVLTRARAYLDAIPKPEIGHGSDAAVFVAACHLVRGFNVSRVEAEALLWDWCGNRDGWTREWITQKVFNAHQHGQEQFGALL